MPAHYIHGTVVLVVVCTYALQANIAHSSAYCYSYRPHSSLPTVCIPLPTPFPAPKVYDTQKPVCLFCLLWFRVYISSVVVPCLYLLLFSLLYNFKAIRTHIALCESAELCSTIGTHAAQKTHKTHTHSLTTSSRSKSDRPRWLNFHSSIRSGLRRLQHGRMPIGDMPPLTP